MSALERIKMAPTFGNGKICYIEMPATDIDRSAEFYQKIFGWDVRKRGDGSIGFDDGVGEVSATWVLRRQPVSDAGMVISIMVDDIVETLDRIVAEGCEIVEPVGAHAPELTALFRDPGGNVMSLYQHRR
jgi:predicted enzyme related to lactoylglutathione lyase